MLCNLFQPPEVSGANRNIQKKNRQTDLRDTEFRFTHGNNLVLYLSLQLLYIIKLPIPTKRSESQDNQGEFEYSGLLLRVMRFEPLALCSYRFLVLCSAS